MMEALVELLQPKQIPVHVMQRIVVVVQRTNMEIGQIGQLVPNHVEMELKQDQELIRKYQRLMVKYAKMV